MRVRVLYFGALKDIFFKDREMLDLPAGSDVASLLDHYREIAPEQGNFWDILAIAVNTEYALPSQPLAEGDEVALLPPVSGGSDSPGTHVALTRERIEAVTLMDSIKTGADGAVAAFDGIVRNNTRGRRTLFLDYEAYESMALAQMRKLAEDAVERFGVRGVTMVHRLGRLEVGETSVFIAVASAHRAAAMDACRWLIDTLKKTVPIWKKEHFEDGAVWANGEPFPEEFVLAAAPAELKQ